MSSFKVEVVQVGQLVDHDNADSLQITRVFDYPVVVKKGEFKEGDAALYVPIDAVVPFRPEWEFIHGGAEDTRHRRIKAKRLRGVFSMGLLVDLEYAYLLEEGHYFSVGADLTEYTGITKYEPPEPKTYVNHGVSTNCEVPGFPRYTDIENIRRHSTVLQEGEEVVITEKIHGANWRAGWWPVNDVMEFHVGSHSTFRKDREEGVCRACKGTGAPVIFITYDITLGGVTCQKCDGTGKFKDFHDSGAGTNIWWRVVDQYDLKEKLLLYPGYFVFGEVFGDVQDLKYGRRAGEVDLRIFDVFDAHKQRYVNFDQLCYFSTYLGIELPPVIYKGPWQHDLTRHADGRSYLAAEQLREGCVIKPTVERFDHRLGRVILKAVSEEYLLRKGGSEGK